MNVVVFIRPVHHTALSIVPGKALAIETLPGYQAVANPKDELALETALALKESNPGEVHLTVCAVGAGAAFKVLQECLFYNIDAAILLEESCWEPDGLITAGHMADFYRRTPFDMVLLGVNDTDTGIGQTGPMFSALTGLPYFDSVVDSKWLDKTQLEILRRQKRLQERIHVSLPAVFGILRGTPLRYHSFWGKLKAQQRSVQCLTSSRTTDRTVVKRKRITRSKPKTTAMAGGYGQVRSTDRIRQAVGILSSGPAQKGDGLIKGRPEDMAKKAISLLKKEKLLE